MSADIVRQKYFLRLWLKQRVLALSGTERQAEEKAATDALRARPLFKRAGTVALYLARPPEFDTNGLLRACRDGGKRVALPMVLPESKQLLFVSALTGASLRKNVYGCAEPGWGEAVAPEDIDLVVVPGAGFTTRGHRLGSGGGFYDRWLAVHRRPTVALCYGAQLMPTLPTEPHDVRVDHVFSGSRG